MANRWGRHVVAFSALPRFPWRRSPMTIRLLGLRAFGPAA